MSRVLVRIFRAKITGVECVRWGRELRRMFVEKCGDFEGFLAFGAGGGLERFLKDFHDFC